jgi:hypothetical protein
MVLPAHPEAPAARPSPPNRRSLWPWRLAALLLLALVGSLGCNPLMLPFFLMPQDPKCPPDCPLTEANSSLMPALSDEHQGSLTRVKTAHPGPSTDQQ